MANNTPALNDDVYFYVLYTKPEWSEDEWLVAFRTDSLDHALRVLKAQRDLDLLFPSSKQIRYQLAASTLAHASPQF